MTARNDLFIRTAVPADAAILDRWDQKPHVKNAVSDTGAASFDVNWQDELGSRDDGTSIWIAEWQGKAIAAMQIIDPYRERTHYWGAVARHLRAIDIWIGEEQYLGQGIGTRMMQFAIKHCFAEPLVTAILVDPLSSNVRAHRFYERLGFRFVEQRRFDDDSQCFVFKLIRDDWDNPDS